MRQSIGEALVSINEGRVDLNAYAGVSCSTCIHQDKHAFEEPCKSCSSVTRADGRDYRTATRHHWTPNFEAQVHSIKEFYRRYPKNNLEFLLNHPPKRCINPKCKYEHSKAYDRGLCKDCHYILQKAVNGDRSDARDMLLLAGMSGSDFEYECFMVAYGQLYTWHRFITRGLALPVHDDYDKSVREMGLQQYYAAVQKNDGADPTRRQMYCRGLKKAQVERLSDIVSFKD